VKNLPRQQADDNAARPAHWFVQTKYPAKARFYQR